MLFVTNGNGEIAIADRIAAEIRDLAPSIHLDHLALVGAMRAEHMQSIGPLRQMPSGGLIAMGNVENIARDLRAGLIGLTLEQRRTLVASRGRYDRVVAVGDVYALLMALAARAPATYVGTAKSVRVAGYGPLERAVLRRADTVFVRDRATAQRLETQGVDARAPGNVIVDIFASADDDRAGDAVFGFDPAIAIFPGSRESAYEDGAFLCSIIKLAASNRPQLGGVLSIAPVLDAGRFASAFARNWNVVERPDDIVPFELREDDRTLVRAWRGAIGPLLKRVLVVAGQAGTANEAAAAAGVPVVAFERNADRKNAWYRMRQRGLLGDALAVLSGDSEKAAAQLGELLNDPARRTQMSAAGRSAMGKPGGARAIALSLVGAA
ncbi:MAG: hypothetical protein M3R51_05000 [Candidatus Eremiobacteraeota bacterium]|nr:hypothetical protein [Candidatus Eremiobacteraeota bacterium]